MRKVVFGFAVTFALIAVFIAVGWAGYRYTTTVVHPSQPTPYDGHPDSRCSWCHRVSEDAPLYPVR